MTGSRNRVEVMHGVNLDQLGRRHPEHYGGLSYRELEVRLVDYGRELGLEVSLFQTNHEGEFVERLHRLEGLTDAVVLNPGAWTHYSWAIHDALELSGLIAVEVHLSDIKAREPWRHLSVIEDLCVATFTGRGSEGYREALQRVKEELDA
jgi:3-dehydroquinate dehydratase-2